MPHPAAPRTVLVIERRRRSGPDFAEVWAYRELLYFLVWRDVQVRYKQTLLGVAWAVLQPLTSMAIFTLLFGRLAGFSRPGVPYPLYAYSGFVLWTFFANAVTSASNSLVGNAHLVTKVYFPRLIIPAAAVAGAVVDFALGLLPLAVLLAWYRVLPGWSWLAAPLPFAGTALLALGVGTLLAALNVRYRDVRHAVPFVVQLWMFSTPTFYSLDVVPPRWRFVGVANPVTGWLGLFRAALLGLPLDLRELIFAIGGTLSLLLIGFVVFRRMERSFADVV